MTGHIRRRGERSWELKFDLGTDPSTGNRMTRYRNFKGTKREAQAELTRLKAMADRGTYIDPIKLTLSAFLDRWESDWARANVSAKSFERYSELLQLYVRPRIGHTLVQKLAPSTLAKLYSDLLQNGRKVESKSRGKGLSAATVGYVHRVLHRALGHAVTWGVIADNPAVSVETPRRTHIEVGILTANHIEHVLRKLKGRTLYPIAILGLATGMRRGELLALRWRDVDLERAQLRVQQSLEQTKAGLRFKSPKTVHGRRTIALPPSVITALRNHKRLQREQRLALGLGKDADDGLVFRHPDGTPLLPHSISTQWRRTAQALGFKVTLHAWRHTHASQLIASGMDVLSISRRLGHGSPSITLDVYGHLITPNDDRAAIMFENAFGHVLTE